MLSGTQETFNKEVSYIIIFQCPFGKEYKMPTSFVEKQLKY